MVANLSQQKRLAASVAGVGKRKSESQTDTRGSVGEG